MSQAINPLPYIVQAQRLFAGQISFGDVMQSATAFQAIHDSLSFFRNAYDSFASYRAALIRLDGLIDANRALPQAPPADRRNAADDARPAAGERRRAHARGAAVDPVAGPAPRLPATAWSIKGPSGSGKTVLLESLAGLWPYAVGRRRTSPSRRGRRCSCPSCPTSRSATSARSRPTRVPSGAVVDDDIQQALLKVALPHLIIRIKEVRDWGKMLSIGEQQRDRVRPHPAERAEGRVPRRVHLGDGRGPRADALRADPDGAARRDSGQRESSGHRRTAPRPAAGTARRRRLAARPSPPRPSEPSAGVAAGRGTLPGWTNGHVHPDAGLGHRGLDVTVVDRQGLGDRRGGHAWSSWC